MCLDTLAETENLMVVELVGENTTSTEFDLLELDKVNVKVIIKYISDSHPFSMISQKLLNITTQDPEYIGCLLQSGSVDPELTPQWP